MVQLSPLVATPKTPKMAKSKTPKKSSAVVTPAKPEVKTPKQTNNTPAKAVLQTPKLGKEVLGKEEKSTPKVATLQTPKLRKNTPKAAAQTPKNGTTSAKKNKTKTPTPVTPSEDVEMESEGEEEVPLAEPSPKKEAVIKSNDSEMSAEVEENEVKPKSGKSSAPKKQGNSKKARKRKSDNFNQPGGDLKRRITNFDNELFVARLSFSSSEDTIREHFSQFGEVISVRLPMKPNSSKNKGFAFVAFKEASALQKAMADTNQEIDSAKIVNEPIKKVVVKEAFPKPSHPNKLFVDGLANSTQKHTLELHFSRYGKVTNVTLPWNKQVGMNTGFGFVSFESATSLESALEQDHVIDGNKIGVKAAGSKSADSAVSKKVKALPAKVENDENDEELDAEGEDEEDDE